LELQLFGLCCRHSGLKAAIGLKAAEPGCRKKKTAEPGCSYKKGKKNLVGVVILGHV